MAHQYLDTVRTFRALSRGHRFHARISPAKSGTPLEETRLPAPLAKSAAPAPMPEKVCELYLYDAIGADFFGDGITAKVVNAAVKEAEGAGCSSMSIFINSPGGDVFEATAIHNVLARFAGPKHVYVDALAASAASYIAMVGDTITTAPNAMWMVHNPWGMAIGDSAAMREAADLLDKVGTTLVGTYAKRTGLSADRITSIMAEETWMTADEAMALGFTDEVRAASDPEPDYSDPNEDQEPGEKEVPPPSAAATAILSKFKNVPKNLRPDARALIASMEARASPRQDPRTGAAAKSSTTIQTSKGRK